ncbi:MAG TPA: hypothetical protein VJT67_15715 [Longimicrobiaceae bacterium]|nr:hypothetical protein [Longimicrobiaceae bacterium]
MKKPTVLRPHDIAVALQVVLTPRARFVDLAASLGLSAAEVHNAVRRLQKARLLSVSGRSASVPALQEFAVYGVPYAFPAELGPESRGVPTSHSAPPLAEWFGADDAVVWPSEDGEVRGHSLVPLLPSAPRLARTNPSLYRLLTLLDALRIGQARERTKAKVLLEQALREGPA